MHKAKGKRKIMIQILENGIDSFTRSRVQISYDVWFLGENRVWVQSKARERQTVAIHWIYSHSAESPTA